MNSVNSLNHRGSVKPKYLAKPSTVRFGMQQQEASTTWHAKEPGNLSFWQKAWEGLKNTPGCIVQAFKSAWDFVISPIKYFFPSLFSQESSHSPSSSPASPKEEPRLHIERDSNKIISCLQENDFKTAQSLWDKIPKEQRIETIEAVLASIPEDQRVQFINHIDEDHLQGGHGHSLYGYGACPEVLRAMLNSVSKANRTVIATHANKSGFTPLHWSALWSNLEVTKVLLDEIPPEQQALAVTQPNNKGDMPLLYAAMWYRPELFKRLIDVVPEDQRAEIICKPNNDGSTPLSQAIYTCNSLEMLQGLLNWIPESQRTAFIKRVDAKGRNMLHNLVSSGKNLEFLATLLQYVEPSILWEVDNQQNTLLHMATRSHNPAMVQAVLKATPKADRVAFVQQANLSGNLPLHLVGHDDRGTPDMLKMLLEPIPPAERAALVNQANNSGQTPLHVIEQYANNHGGLHALGTDSKTSWLVKAGILLAYGADPNSLTPAFRTQVLANIQNWGRINCGQLIDSDDPETVRKAMQWYQQFPIARPADSGKQQGSQPNVEPPNNGSEEQQNQPILDWQPTIQQCNEYLQSKTQQLANPYLTRRQKIAILARCRPILKSGIPINLDLQNQLITKAKEVKYVEFLRDTIVENANFTTVNALKELMPERSLQNEANAPQENTTTPL